MHARTTALATIAILAATLTACGTTQGAGNAASPTPSPTTATVSPSNDIIQQFVDWRDGGGGDTVETLVDDLSAVDEASDPVDLDGLRDSCSTLTADVEAAQSGDPLPDAETDERWNLALEHLAASATACSNGSISGEQAAFDLMASEMDIGIKHLDAVVERLSEVLPE